jgi:hypothetical protein
VTIAVLGFLATSLAASADELSDLRADQDLLSQRIDQLAQTSTVQLMTPPPGPAAPGGGSFPRSFMIPGTDTSIRVGGFVDETIDYFLQNGPANGNPSTTVEINGNLGAQPLDVHGQVVPGYGPGGYVVPVQTAHSRGNGIFQQTPSDSRLNVETRTPTAWGESRTFVEIDFKGCSTFSCNQLNSVSDNLLPRLRYAYGTLGGLMAGQANSNFRDSDAEPELLALDGPPGMAGPIRIPQLRYTWNNPIGTGVLSVSAEAPETDVITPAGKISSDGSAQVSVGGTFVYASNATPGNVACVANGVSIPGTTACTLAGDPAVSKAPDLTFASYWSQPWGHVDVHLVGRDLTLNDGRFVDRSFFGYGGGISGDVRPGWFGWKKDDFLWELTAGNGLGRYLTDATDAGLATNYVVAPTSAAAANGIIVKPVPEVGGILGYQHWWLANLRSTAVFGYAHYEYPSQLIGPVESTVANKQLMTANVNLIWSPVAFIDTGVEYLWGQRQVVANLYGTEQVLIGKFRVKF